MTSATKTRLLVLVALALLLAPLLGIEPRTYLTLTVAGLAMGMLVFLVASGLTLIFGLMDVLNFAHGALFSWGAFAGFSVAVLLDRRLHWAAIVASSMKASRTCFTSTDCSGPYSLSALMWTCRLLPTREDRFPVEERDGDRDSHA